VTGPDDYATDHRAVWELIPWLVNGSATAEERRLALAHLAQCEACSDEVARQEALRAAIAGARLVTDARDAEAVSADAHDGATPESRAALLRLFARIDADVAPPTPAAAPMASVAPAPLATPLPSAAPPRSRGASTALVRGLLAAVIIEAIGLAASGIALLRAPVPGVYRTLSEAPAPVAAGAIRVVFAPATSVDALQSLLLSLRLVIVAGPTPAGVYTLAPSFAGGGSAAPAEAAPATTLAQLRARPEVRFAESLAPPAPQP